ncbi:MAG: glycosyltransferase [Candidatus Omnitrophota bacterium]
MKVLHIIPGLSPNYGGPTETVIKFCKALHRKGIAVELITTDADVNGNLEVEHNEPVLEYGFPVRYFKAPFFRRYGFSPDLGKWLKDNAKMYDIFHIHSVMSYTIFPACFYALKYNIPYIIRPCGMLEPEVLSKKYVGKISSMIGYMKKMFFLKLIKERLEKASSMHFTCEQEMEKAGFLDFNVKGFVLPMGIEEEFDSSARDKISNKRKTVLFLSRISPKKGLDLLIPALGRLAEEGKDFDFVIAGNGEEKYVNYIKLLVKKYKVESRTVFKGFVQGAEKRKLLESSDIFVLPSYSENFGMAVIEAMSAGIPVIISNKVGIHRELNSQKAALVVECNIEHISSAVKSLLEDESFAKDIAANGRNLAGTYYNVNDITERVVKIYEELLS